MRAIQLLVFLVSLGLLGCHPFEEVSDYAFPEDLIQDKDQQGEVSPGDVQEDEAGDSGIVIDVGDAHVDVAPDQHPEVSDGGGPDQDWIGPEDWWPDEGDTSSTYCTTEFGEVYYPGQTYQEGEGLCTTYRVCQDNGYFSEAMPEYEPNGYYSEIEVTQRLKLVLPWGFEAEPSQTINLFESEPLGVYGATWKVNFGSTTLLQHEELRFLHFREQANIHEIWSSRQQRHYEVTEIESARRYFVVNGDASGNSAWMAFTALVEEASGADYYRYPPGCNQLLVSWHLAVDHRNQGYGAEVMAAICLDDPADGAYRSLDALNQGQWLPYGTVAVPYCEVLSSEVGKADVVFFVENTLDMKEPQNQLGTHLPELLIALGRTGVSWRAGISRTDIFSPSPEPAFWNNPPGLRGRMVDTVDSATKLKLQTWVTTNSECQGGLNTCGVGGAAFQSSDQVLWEMAYSDDPELLLRADAVPVGVWFARNEENSPTDLSIEGWLMEHPWDFQGFGFFPFGASESGDPRRPRFIEATKLSGGGSAPLDLEGEAMVWALREIAESIGARANGQDLYPSPIPSSMKVMDGHGFDIPYESFGSINSANPSWSLEPVSGRIVLWGEPTPPVTVLYEGIEAW